MKEKQIFYIAECELCGAKYIKTNKPRFDERVCQCGNLVYYKESCYKEQDENK